MRHVKRHPQEHRQASRLDARRTDPVAEAVTSGGCSGIWRATDTVTKSLGAFTPDANENLPHDVRYAYDGWNSMAILDHQCSILYSFTWGLDLSGTMQGAGGVGGLLAIIDASQGSHFCAYDGNGNVAALLKADGSGLSAQYEYGPFGELLRATGPMARANPFRFSTKYQDDETDLIYYGYRYYDASTGRWPSRDPIEERGGLNLYGFAGNSPLNGVDPFGLLKVEATTEGFEVTAWGVTQKVGPDGGEVTFNKTIWQSDASVALVGGYSLDGKAKVDLKLLSIPAKDCVVKSSPFSLNSDFSVHLWPPSSIQFALEFASGGAAKGRISLTQTISFPYSSVTYASEFDGKSRVWGVKCGKCLEIKSHVEATTSYHYNYMLVFAAAYAVATGPVAILTEPLPAATGL